MDLKANVLVLFLFLREVVVWKIPEYIIWLWAVFIIAEDIASNYSLTSISCLLAVCAKLWIYLESVFKCLYTFDWILLVVIPMHSKVLHPRSSFFSPNHRETITELAKGLLFSCEKICFVWNFVFQELMVFGHCSKYIFILTTKKKKNHCKLTYFLISKTPNRNWISQA